VDEGYVTVSGTGWDGKAGDEAVWDRVGMGTRDVLGPWQRRR